MQYSGNSRGVYTRGEYGTKATERPYCKNGLVAKYTGKIIRDGYEASIVDKFGKIDAPVRQGRAYQLSTVSYSIGSNTYSHYDLLNSVLELDFVPMSTSTVGLVSIISDIGSVLMLAVTSTAIFLRFPNIANCPSASYNWSRNIGQLYSIRIEFGDDNEVPIVRIDGVVIPNTSTGTAVALVGSNRNKTIIGADYVLTGKSNWVIGNILFNFHRYACNEEDGVITYDNSSSYEYEVTHADLFDNAGELFYSGSYIQLSTEATSLIVEVDSQFTPSSLTSITVDINDIATELKTTQVGINQYHIELATNGVKTVRLYNGINTGSSRLQVKITKLISNKPITIYAPIQQIRTAYIIGDSISVGANAVQPQYSGWIGILKRHYPGVSFVNDSNGGASVSYFLADSDLGARLSSIIEPDIVYVALGTNDFGLNKYATLPLFESALSSLINNIQVECPNANIILQTPVIRTDIAVNSYGHTLQDYRDSIIAVANTYSLQVINGLQLISDTDLHTDLLHPSTNGHVVYANNIISLGTFSSNDVVTTPLEATVIGTPNINNLTITNATLSLFHTEDYRFSNHANTVGYAVDAITGAIKPVSQAVEGDTVYNGRIRLNAEIANSWCGLFDGLITLSHPDLTGVAIDSYLGTATPSIAGNIINVTAGYLYYLKLSDGSEYTIAEGSGNNIFDKINGRHLVIVGATLETFWSPTGPYSHNLLNGFSLNSNITAGRIPAGMMYNKASIVPETTARKQYTTHDYDGAEVTCGTGGTYATLSAAIAAVANNGIVRLVSDVNIDLEPSGYVLINLVKSFKIDGGNYTATSTNANVYCIRIRTVSTLTIENLTIHSVARDPILNETGVYSYDSVVNIVGCTITSTAGNSSGAGVKISGTVSKSYINIVDTVLDVNNNYGIYNYNNHPETYLLIDNCTVKKGAYGNGASIFSSSLTNGWTYVYDTEVYHRSNSPIVIIGTDTAVPTLEQNADIRGCSFYLLDTVQHGLLFGRGTKKVICQNNSIWMQGTSNTAAIGIVVKTISDSIDKSIFSGNSVLSMRAIYIKGGSNNIIANNVGVSNSSGAFGYGISLLNTIEADLVPLNCNNNTIQNNTFVGTSVAFEASNTVDTEAILITLATCTVDNNTYYSNEDYYARISDVLYLFSQREEVWSQDVNSVFAESEKTLTKYDVYWQELTNPATGYHNGAESQMTLPEAPELINADKDFWFDSDGNAVARSIDEIVTQDSYFFVNESKGYVTDMLYYSDDIENECLLKTLRYVKDVITLVSADDYILVSADDYRLIGR